VENRRVAIGPRNLVLRTESRCGGLDLLEKAKTLGKTKTPRGVTLGVVTPGSSGRRDFI
jgi:hypothetical protein